MKNTSVIKPLALTATLTCLAVLLCSAPANGEPSSEKKTVQQWEYRVVTFRENRGLRSEEVDARDKSSQQQLNQLGAEGWELVTVRENSGADPVFYFKRPVN